MKGKKDKNEQVTTPTELPAAIPTSTTPETETKESAPTVSTSTDFKRGAKVIFQDDVVPRPFQTTDYG